MHYVLWALVLVREQREDDAIGHEPEVPVVRDQVRNVYPCVLAMASADICMRSRQR
jgi:hypothetical protein